MYNRPILEKLVTEKSIKPKRRFNLGWFVVPTAQQKWCMAVISFPLQHSHLLPLGKFLRSALKWSSTCISFRTTPGILMYWSISGYFLFIIIYLLFIIWFIIYYFYLLFIILFIIICLLSIDYYSDFLFFRILPRSQYLPNP